MKRFNEARNLNYIHFYSCKCFALILLLIFFSLFSIFLSPIHVLGYSNIFISKNGFSIKSISFNSINEPIGNYLLNYKKEINVLGCLKDNFWNNKKTLQLVVSDLII